LWDCRNVVAGSGVVDLVDEDAEESGGLFTRVWLELGLDLDEECGGHGGEQTSLYTKSARPRRGNIEETYKYQGGVHVFVVLLDKLSVVFFCLVAVLLVEFRPEIPLG